MIFHGLSILIKKIVEVNKRTIVLECKRVECIDTQTQGTEEEEERKKRFVVVDLVQIAFSIRDRKRDATQQTNEQNMHESSEYSLGCGHLCVE